MEMTMNFANTELVNLSLAEAMGIDGGMSDADKHFYAGVLVGLLCILLL